VSVFVDTSFLVALLDEDDRRSSEAKSLWRKAADELLAPVTTNYVILETCAVLQRRMGLPAVRRLVREVLAPVTIEWVSHDDHERATEALLVAGRRQLSLVDCTSFEVMRRLSLDSCLAFDPHFAAQGFSVAGEEPSPAGD
jgi:predicted nucleic acid-binding protein